jgi:hypothetical protein
MHMTPNCSDVPSCYAVQLMQSAQPIDAASVATLPFFREFTLYAIETVRHERAWHCLRLGFFADADAAGHVLQCVRRIFGSASVVVVAETEWDEVASIVPHEEARVPAEHSSHDETIAIFALRPQRITLLTIA